MVLLTMHSFWPKCIPTCAPPFSIHPLFYLFPSFFLFLFNAWPLFSCSTARSFKCQSWIQNMQQVFQTIVWSIINSILASIIWLFCCGLLPAELLTSDNESCVWVVQLLPFSLSLYVSICLSHHLFVCLCVSFLNFTLSACFFLCMTHSLSCLLFLVSFHVGLCFFCRHPSPFLSVSLSSVIISFALSTTRR